MTAVIVTGTDGSASAAETVRQAAKLAQTQSAELHIVTAYAGGNPGDAVHTVLERSRDALVDVEIPVHLHAEPGEPATALCGVAERVGADLLIVGNKGVDGLRPSVSELVQRQAPCAVLVVDTEPYWHVVDEAAAGRRRRLGREWRVLLVTTVAVFMAFLDVTIVNVAFPQIQADFPETSLADLSWVLNAYNVVFAAMLVPAGRLADRIGQRRMFFAGLWLFLAGTVLCGAAPDPWALVAARVVQAAGAAALIPTSLALVLPEFPPERRAVATSVWAATGAVAAALGPSLGGVLVDAGGWRWAFWVNLVVALAVVPARWLLVERRDPVNQGPPDLLGGALLAGAIGALALGIVKAPDWGWGSDRVLLAWGVALALAAWCAARSRRHPSPVLEPALLRVRSFALGSAAMLVLSIGFYALLLANVLFLTQEWGYSVLEAGFGVSPAPLAAAVAAAIGGRLTERKGPRVVLVPAVLGAAVACLLYRGLTGSEPDYLATWLPAQLVSGAAIGMAFAAVTTATVMDLPPNRLATGTALASCARQIGAVIGIALLVAVLDTPSPAAFDEAWALMAVAFVAAGAVATRLPRGRADEIGERAPLRSSAPGIEVPGLERHTMELHGHRVVYRTAGEGPVVLLVHGLLDSSLTWRKVAPVLALGHRVIAPDLLGHGESDGPPSVDYSLGGHAGMLRDLLDALGIERVTLVGHSLGGGVAMAFAYHYPHRVERLGLVSSGGLGRSVSIGLRAATVPGAGPLMRTIGARPVVAVVRRSAAVARSCGLRQVARVVLGLSHTLERIADSARRSAFLKTARAVIDGHGQKVSALDRFGAMGDMPVLVLWGTRDAIIPADHAHRVKEVDPDAELVMLDGIGHTPQLSQPAFVAERIATWIGTTEPARLDGRPRAVEPVTAP